MPKQNSTLTPLFDTLAQLKSTAAQAKIKTTCQAEFDLALNFLYSYRGSQATFNAYRRELERLLQWSWGIHQQSILQLKPQDIETFIEFCQQPPGTWIGTKQVKRFTNLGGYRQANPDWRPFVCKQSVNSKETKAPVIKKFALSHKAVQAIFSILSSFYNYLMQESAIDYNPVAQIRQKSKFIRKQQTKKIIRRLSELQWSYVIETAEQQALKEPQYERSLFIVNALYGMYLRISELASSARWTPEMGDFFQDQDGHWWFKTIGKGNKERQISVSDAMLAALKRYRAYLGLNKLPALGEHTPLVSQLNRNVPITSTRQIRKLVQACFDAAYLRMQQDGLGEDAQALQSATVHWLRHTGISDDVKVRPREHVRDDAGHGSSAITDQYIDIELRERHASARKKSIKPDCLEVED
jgi:site-specific recombinase XerD